MGEIELELPLDEVPAAGEPIPAGVYELVVDNVEQALSKSGNLKLNLTFRVGRPVAVEFNGVAVETSGRVISHQISLSKKSLPWLKQFLKAGDIPFKGSVIDTDDIIGARVNGRVAIEPAKARNKETGELEETGEFRNVIRGFMKP